MKIKKFIILIILICSMQIYAQDKDAKISVLLEFLGSSPSIGLNVQYSPNYNWDLGLGLAPSIYPVIETHFYGRYNFLDNFISPFIQVSGTLLYPGQINDNTDWFFGRIETGMKMKFAKNWFIGLGGGYQALGSKNIIPFQYKGLYPTVFVGYSSISL